jgi:hypothetical protein
MKTPRNAAERAVCIELVRANIALGRERIAVDVRTLGRELAPGHLVTRFVSGTAARTRASGWLRMIPGLLMRYPVLASLAYSALSAGRRRGRGRWWWAGPATLAGLAWLTTRSKRDGEQS